MNNRNILTSPHQHPHSVVSRYLEGLMDLTYKNPVLMKDLIYGIGIGSLVLISSPWTFPALGLTAPLSTTAALLGGAAGFAGASVNGFMQQRFYGLPVPDSQHFYAAKKYVYESATAELTVDQNELPRLVIEAVNPFDAGYAEGYILGEAIKDNLEGANFLYPALQIFLNAPNNDKSLKKQLDKILQTIPERYRDEMLGKVQGYNDWLSEHHQNAAPLTFERYLLFQVMPDLYNYNPFLKNKMGCTTAALRLGDYTFLVRVLDWPAHNVAGKSFLQIERQIGLKRRISDIGMPLLSGAATVLNDKGVLIEINISPGDKVTEPAGMPAFFFNRHCAEHATTVKDIEKLLQYEQPLGAYHLTATDGCDTQSFHFYQSKDAPNKHVIESLDKDTQSPQLLVVANNGVKEGQDVNYCDSDERKENIHQFFNRHKELGTFKPYIEKQSDFKLSRQDVTGLEELLLQMARLPLVNNCESVLCAMYVYRKNEILEAIVSTDNMFAQNKELENFRRISF